MRFHDNTIPVTREVPAAGTVEFDEWASALGNQFARGGSRSVESHLLALARRARELNIAAVSASVLADRHSPEVARARAFARVVAALGRLTRAHTVALDTVA